MNRNHILFFAIAVLCIHSSTASGQLIRTVALSGQSAPGTTAGVTFASFGTPVIDSTGQVSFRANLQPLGVVLDADTGLWTEDAGSLKLIAREYGDAPGYFNAPIPLGTYFRDFLHPGFADPPIITAGNRTLVRASLFGHDQNGDLLLGEALYKSIAAQLALITGVDMHAPGASSASEFRAFRDIELHNNGHIAFSAVLAVGSEVTESGIWTDARGDLELVALTGSQIAGMPVGITLDPYPHVGRPALNSQGKLAFVAAIREPDASSSPKPAILTGLPGSLNVVVRGEDQAPGTALGTTFRQFNISDPSSPKLDSEGRMLFGARLIGSGIDDTNNDGFWLEDAGSIRLVAREGNQAPDLPSGVNFFNLSPPLFNSSGQIALHSQLVGPGIDTANDGAIWKGTPDSLSLLLQKGDAAPGLSGQVFTQLSPAAFNETGRMVIRGQFPGLAYPGGVSNHGIWAQDTEGQLQLIVKTGDLLEVAAGDFRKVDFLQFGGFNDHGQVVFRASFGVRSFQTTSGVFVSNLVAVPEPISIVILLGCLGAWPCRTSR